MLNRNVMSWWCLTMTYKMLTVGNMFKGTDGKLPRTKNSIEGWHQSFNLTCPPSPLFFERYSIKLKIIWLLNLPSASCESFLSTTITMTFSRFNIKTSQSKFRFCYFYVANQWKPSVELIFYRDCYYSLVYPTLYNYKMVSMALQR